MLLAFKNRFAAQPHVALRHRFADMGLCGARQVQQRERKNIYLIEDFSSSEEEEETYRQGKKRENRRTRRLNRRTDRGDMNIFDARKRMLLESKKTPFEKDNARRIANLGPGGCPACMSNPCKHVPVVNLEVRMLGAFVYNASMRIMSYEAESVQALAVLPAPVRERGAQI